MEIPPRLKRFNKMTNAIIDTDAEQAKRDEIRARAQKTVIIAEVVEK